MKPNFSYSRREMLRLGCRAVSAIGAASAFGPMGQVSALAQAAGDYKALVCIFLFGGNDSNNCVVPLSATGYADYQRVRQTLALGQGSLLPVATGTESYGLHPSLAGLRTLYQQNKVAIVSNVGTLVQPLTKAEYQNGNQNVPMNLFSHSDQQQQWQNAAPRGGPAAASGWSGRIADKVQVLNVPATFPPAVGVSGGALQLIGQQTKPTTVSGVNFGLDGSDGSPAANARDAALQEMLTLDSGAVLVQAASKTIGDSLAVIKLIQEATKTATPLLSQFPGTGLGNQLAQIARVIQIRAALGVRRQLFFASMGGYDTHGDQMGQHAGLLNELNNAMVAFYNATGELGVQNGVTTFTESEFNRTFQPNSTAGTDHAWGGHCFVLGGAVAGGRMYGRFPTLALRGPDDSGTRGNWIPSIALDQYGATLARWFDVQEFDLPAVFPNIGNFQTKTIGFMG